MNFVFPLSRFAFTILWPVQEPLHGSPSIQEPIQFVWKSFSLLRSTNKEEALKDPWYAVFLIQSWTLHKARQMVEASSLEEFCSFHFEWFIRRTLQLIWLSLTFTSLVLKNLLIRGFRDSSRILGRFASLCLPSLFPHLNCIQSTMQTKFSTTIFIAFIKKKNRRGCWSSWKNFMQINHHFKRRANWIVCLERAHGGKKEKRRKLYAKSFN